MKYIVDIVEHNEGQIEIEATSRMEAEDIASTRYYNDPQMVDWYKSETTFNGLTGNEIFEKEVSDYDCCDCGCNGHCGDCSPDNRCLFCGEIIPEGRMVCPSCEADEGGERNGRQTRCMEQRKPQSGGMASRFRRGIPRLFGR